MRKMAQAYGKFVPQVTVIERHERVLEKEDNGVFHALVGIVKGEGVRIITSAIVEKVTGFCCHNLHVAVNVR
jgi:pyruvate/2-oxoglutarate dehydrogenase complex dihydrolipoamide dehydrogenase (E3) component